MNRGSLLLGCLGAITLLAAPSFGDAKYDRKSNDKIAPTDQKYTKIVQKPKEEKKRPELTADDVFLGQGEKLKSVTDSQIKVLQKLIDNTADDDPEKPDYLFRMAELYAEQQHYFNFKARELDAKIFDAQSKNAGNLASQLQGQQKDYEKREKQWLVAAVKEYKAIIDNDKFNDYKRMDQVLFYLAYLLTQQKRDDLARPVFKRLIKDYPKSQYLPDAYLSFGQFYFDNKDIENALVFYDKVLKYPESRVYGYAKYMEGWCYFNLQDFKKALEIFVDVITTTKAGKGDSNKIALVKEAKKDAVRAYSNLAGADKAWQFFQRIGGDYAPTMLEMLGDAYNGQGKFDESIKVYRQLMKLNPSSPKLCFWQQQVLTNTLSRTGSRATPDAVQELTRLSSVYEKFRTMQGVKQTAIDECREITAGSLRELATTWHVEGIKTKVKETYDLAKDLYKEYIARFPKEKDIYVMTDDYAELLWKLEKYCDAAPIFTQVVMLDPSDKAKYRNDAALAAVQSWKNCLNVDETGQDAQELQKKKGLGEEANKKTAKGGKQVKEEAPDTKPKDLPEKAQKMIAAFRTYIKYVPSSNELSKIMYDEARVYYEFNHFAEAAPLFRSLVQKYQNDEVSIPAFNLMLDCEQVLNQFDNLEADAKQLCPVFGPKDPGTKQNCDSILAGLERKRIESWQATGQYRKAADAYVKLANDHPDDPKIDELLNNAAANYQKAHAIGAAIAARSKLIQLKPDSELAKKAVYLLGLAYEQIAAYDQAADNFEKFAIKYPGELKKTEATGEQIDASDALFTASFFRRGLGEIDKSIKDTSDFIKLYGGRKEYEDRAAGVYFNLYQIYEAQHDAAKLESHLKSYLKQWGTKGGLDRQIRANVKLGELAWRESCPVAGVNGACVEISRVRASSATRIQEKAGKTKRRKKKGAHADLPAQCGPETKTKIVLHERKPASAKQAQAYFAAALKLAPKDPAVGAKKVGGKEGTPEHEIRVDDMYFAIAEARMMQGDQEYEKALAMRIPDKLDFTDADPGAGPGAIKRQKAKKAESEKKFKDWITNKGKQIVTAQNVYQSVILYKQAHWAIAAAARIGQLFQDFSGQLYTAPVPKAPTAPAGVSQEEVDMNFHDAYCDAMTDQAEPLESKAVEGLKTCLDKSTELSWFNEWSQLCEAELNQIKPAEFPLAAEIRAQPGYLDHRADMAPVIQELK